MGAGQVDLDIGIGAHFHTDKTDRQPDDNELVGLRAVRVIDGDDPTSTTAVQAGSPQADDEVVRLEDLEALAALTPQIYTVNFADQQAIVTPSGFDRVLVPNGRTAKTLTVVGIQLNAQGIGSGTTTVRVCDVAKGGATTNSIAASLGAAVVAAQGVGSFEIVAGASIYIYVEAAGFHTDITATIIVEGF